MALISRPDLSERDDEDTCRRSNESLCREGKEPRGEREVKEGESERDRKD